MNEIRTVSTMEGRSMSVDFLGGRGGRGRTSASGHRRSFQKFGRPAPRREPILLENKKGLWPQSPSLSLDQRVHFGQFRSLIPSHSHEKTNHTHARRHS